MNYPPTIVLRHRRENLKKCSLRGLESREDFRFYQYPNAILPSLKGYIMLALNAPPLSKADVLSGLFILDSTWRYAPVMQRFAEKEGEIEKRSLPHTVRTAYPRRQDDCQEPERGLASAEAIYIAYHLLGRNTDGLLDHYFWKDVFLSQDPYYL